MPKKNGIWIVLAGVFTLTAVPLRIGAAEDTQDRAIRAAGQFGGIGAVLKKSGSELLVSEVRPGSPAEDPNIRPGHKVLSIAGKSTLGIELNEAVQLIRGLAGSELELEIFEPASGLSRKVKLVRRVVTIASVSHRMLNSKIGLLLVNNFSQRTPEQVEAALQEFEKLKANAVIIDLRDNSGGLPSATSDVASMFLPPASVCWLYRKRGESRAEKVVGSLPQKWKGPVAILVGPRTHGGALFASALQQNNRAKVFGQPTAGNVFFGTSQSLPNGGIQPEIHGFFYTLRDEPIYQRGMIPDTLIQPNPNVDDALKTALESLANGH